MTTTDMTPSDVIELTDEQRQALPPRHHQPVWDGLGRPHLWLCAVCWGEGWTTAWPCEVAREHGREVAEAGGMQASL